MSHSYAQNHIHLVFSTKNHQKLLARESLPRLWAYTAGVCKNHDLLTFAVGGMEDHLHVLFRLPPTVTLASAVTLIKSNSSKWTKEKRKSFAWQEGYGAFSVSSSKVDAVVRYIENQEAHHRKITFEDEFVSLLKKHGIAYDRNTCSVSVAAYGALVSLIHAYPGLPGWARFFRPSGAGPRMAKACSTH